MTQHLPVHSGSRWEPWPESATGATALVPPSVAADGASRRRRGPALALLVTLLTVGTASAGVAYVQDTATPGTGSTQVRTRSGSAHNLDQRGSDPRPDGDRRLGGRGVAGGAGAPFVGSPS